MNPATYGPWLVGLGAALWGTESAWRIPLNALFDAKVIVFWEHVLILIMFLPLLVSRLAEIRKIDARTWGYLVFSGFAGSAVGTIFLHARVEIRQSDRRERRSEYSACYLNDGRVPDLRRPACHSLLPLRQHRDPCRNLRFGCASER